MRIAAFDRERTGLAGVIRLKTVLRLRKTARPTGGQLFH
jgi:hypothetical protein